MHEPSFVLKYPYPHVQTCTQSNLRGAVSMLAPKVQYVHYTLLPRNKVLCMMLNSLLVFLFSRKGTYVAVFTNAIKTASSLKNRARVGTGTPTARHSLLFNRENLSVNIQTRSTDFNWSQSEREIWGSVSWKWLTHYSMRITSDAACTCVPFKTMVSEWGSCPVYSSGTTPVCKNEFPGSW